MKILILTVFLTFHTVPPVPRQTPDGPADAAHKVQNQSNAKQKPADPPTPINSEIQPSPTQPHNEIQSDEQSSHHVKVTEFPPISIRRDKIDWALWVFNIALVIVGFLQWRVLRRQADIAHNQELQMIAAGEQTKQIIAQMKESEVRDLRAYVGVSKVILNLQKTEIPQGIVEIQNFGKTPAYKVRHVVGIAAHSYPLTVTFPEPQASQTSPTTSLFPDVKNVNLVDLKKPLPAGTPLGTLALAIYVYGKVTYEDVFGNSWFTNYRFFFARIEQLYQGDKGSLFAAMHPDSEGNEAT